MKEILSDLGDVGFLSKSKYPFKMKDGKLSADTILNRFDSKREAPPDITTAIRLLEEKDKQRAALYLLRIALYAKTNQMTKDLRSWFQHGRISDPESATPLHVSLIQKSATSLLKISEREGKETEKILKISEAKKLTDKQRISLDLASSKQETFKESRVQGARALMKSIEQIYLALGSERK